MESPERIGLNDINIAQIILVDDQDTTDSIAILPSEPVDKGRVCAARRNVRGATITIRVSVIMKSWIIGVACWGRMWVLRSTRWPKYGKGSGLPDRRSNRHSTLTRHGPRVDAPRKEARGFGGPTFPTVGLQGFGINDVGRTTLPQSQQFASMFQEADIRGILPSAEPPDERP